MFALIDTGEDAEAFPITTQSLNTEFVFAVAQNPTAAPLLNVPVIDTLHLFSVTAIDVLLIATAPYPEDEMLAPFTFTYPDPLIYMA